MRMSPEVTPIIKDYTNQKFQEDDDKDFNVKTIAQEKLIDTVPGLDAGFDEDMYNFGDEDDLPYSDRVMECQAKKIGLDACFDK